MEESPTWCPPEGVLKLPARISRRRGLEGALKFKRCRRPSPKGGEKLKWGTKMCSCPISGQKCRPIVKIKEWEIQKGGSFGRAF